MLEAKRSVEYFEIPARSILNRTKPNMPFRWTINPYRGCEFGCKYCYARYAHEFMELRDPADSSGKIFAKAPPTRAVPRGTAALQRRGESIALGTATDPYQPAERRFRITRAILDVFAQERGWTSAWASPPNRDLSRAIWICSTRSRDASAQRSPDRDHGR